MLVGSLSGVVNRRRSGPSDFLPGPPLTWRFSQPFISGGGAAPSEGPEVGRAKIAGRFLPEVESGCSLSGGEAEL